MLEIPESTTLARQVAEAFVGKAVEKVEAAHSAHGFAFYSHPAEEYPALLCGRSLAGANVVGGQLEMVFDDMHLVVNDGVNMRFVAPGGKLPPKHQFHLVFDDGCGLVCTLSMYGGFMAYPHGKTDNFYYLVGLEKPSPLTDAFDRAYFDDLLDAAEDRLSAKALLATEQRIPGLGNGCLQDILWNAGVHPQRRLGDMDATMRARLFSSTKETLAAMAEAGGRDTEKDLFGNPGGYRTVLSNKTKDAPCPRCGGPITRKAYLGGSVYFCPACQPL